jgi:hypothetical protein
VGTLILSKYEIENPENENENENENETLSSQRKQRKLLTMDNMPYSGNPGRRYSLVKAVVSGPCGKHFMPPSGSCRGHCVLRQSGKQERGRVVWQLPQLSNRQTD